MTRREQQIGKNGQEQAAAALRRAGVHMVEKIGTPVKLIPARVAGTFKVIWGEKVSGDHRGILADGTSVLAEAKTILDRNLRWSDLRPHQPERLDEHAQLGGISILVWVHSTGVYVMRWPLGYGFSPKKSLKVSQAETLHVETFQTKEAQKTR